MYVIDIAGRPLLKCEGTVAIHSAAGLQGIHHFGYEMCSFARAAVTNSHTLVALVIEVYHLTVLETASPRPSLGDIFRGV